MEPVSSCHSQTLPWHHRDDHFSMLRCAGFPQTRVGCPGGHGAVARLRASSGLYLGENVPMPGPSWGYFGGFRKLIEEDIIMKRRSGLRVRLRLIREEQLQIDGHTALQSRTQNKKGTKTHQAHGVHLHTH